MPNSPELIVDTQTLSKKLDESMNAIHLFRQKQDEQEKKYDTLNEEYLRKVSDYVSEIAELKQRVDAAELAVKRNIDEKKEGDEKIRAVEKKFFNAFCRSAQQSQTFDSFVATSQLGDADVLKKALSISNDAQGGYLVNTEFGGLVETRIFETSPIRTVANVLNIGSEMVSFLADDIELTSGGWVAESGTRSETNTDAPGKIEIRAHEQYAEPKVTNQFLEDASIDVEGWLSRKISDILSRTENTAFVSGNGVGKPRGILTYDAWSVNGTYETNKIEQIVTGSAGAITSDSLLSIQNALTEPYQANAAWLMRRATFADIMKLKTGSGEYLFNRSLDRKVGTPFDILGTRVIFCADMPAVGSNALSVAYGDFGAGYQIVDRRGIRLIRDFYTSKGFTKFHSSKRVGGGVVNFEAIKILKLAAS